MFIDARRSFKCVITVINLITGLSNSIEQKRKSESFGWNKPYLSQQTKINIVRNGGANCNCSWDRLFIWGKRLTRLEYMKDTYRHVIREERWNEMKNTAHKALLMIMFTAKNIKWSILSNKPFFFGGAFVYLFLQNGLGHVSGGIKRMEKVFEILTSWVVILSV